MTNLKAHYFLLLASLLLPFTSQAADDIDSYIEAAKTGSASAQFILGMKYGLGMSAPKDDKEAVKWFRMAAEQGYPPAQLFLGSAHELGQGATQSYSEAVKWYRKAAEQGDSRAQASLARMYLTGRGTPQNYLEAYAWASTAIANGDNSSDEVRDNSATKLTPEKLEEGQQLAVEYFEEYKLE